MVEFYKTKLKSGLRILFEKRQLPITTILVASQAGAIHENAAKKGVAHFFEHMVFKGTKTRSAKEISSTIEKTGGILNGFTSDEITGFWCKVPSKHFSESAKVIFDLLINPKLDEKDIEIEKPVILSEIAMCHDNPQIYLFDKQKELLYAGTLGMPVIGFKETVAKLKRADLLRWRQNHCPKNLIVSVVGKADLEELKELAKGFMPYKNELRKVKVRKRKGNLIEKRAGLDQTHFTLAFHRPSLSSKERYASEIFNAILGEGMSSKLFQEVREKKGLAYTIKAFLEQEKSYGHSIIYAGIEKKNIKKVKEIALKEIKSMARISSKELEEAKEQKIGNWQLELEACDKTAIALAFQEIATKAEDFYNYQKEIEKVRLEDIKALAKIKNYSTAILIPK